MKLTDFYEFLSRYDSAGFEKAVSTEVTGRNDCKLYVDNIFRSFLIKLMEENESIDIILSVVDMSFGLARKDLCSRSLPVNLLSDLLDATPINRCDQYFAYIERNVVLWKAPEFIETCRNQLLRTCNDLLRRLSRTTDTVFCGRILVFLARCLPLTEKSGLNLTSQFNTDNATKFDTNETSSLQPVKMEVDQPDSDETEPLMMVDYNLYCKFWRLQSVFSSPITCYDKFEWKKFVNNSNEVLGAFASHKLEKHTRRSSSAICSMDVDFLHNKPVENSTYFAKYLTSQKLLQLQLNDNTFRRYILVQFLILYQYLTSDVRFKDKRLHALSDDQAKYISEASQKCYQLLRETQPDGEQFAEAIKRILQREERWNEWKNTGCEDITKKCEPEKLVPVKRRRHAKYDATTLDLGNDSLTRLWSSCADNFEACKAPERQFIPELEDMLKLPVEQADPENRVEEKYKAIHDENYQWRSLRLMAMNSPHFFQQPNNAGANLIKTNVLLHRLLKQTCKDIPKHANCALSNEDDPPNLDERRVVLTSSQNEDEDSDKSSSTAAKKILSQSVSGFGENILTKQQIQNLSFIISEKWKKLAKRMQIPADKLEPLKKNTVPEEACSILLSMWCEMQAGNATSKNIAHLILEADIMSPNITKILREAETKTTTTTKKPISAPTTA